MSEHHTIGVVIATYNGARYIEEQLESIRLQNTPPDLIVFSDANSSDDTLSIINRYKNKFECECIIIENNQQIGPTENFFEALKACKTDVFVLCDQDDFWTKEKIKTISDQMSDASIIGFAHSYSNYSDDMKSIIQFNSLPNTILSGREGFPLFNWPGMAMSFRRNVFEVALPIHIAWKSYRASIIGRRALGDFDYWADCHDTLFLTTARLMGRVRLTSDNLGVRRLHANNATRPSGGWSGKAPMFPDRFSVVDKYKLNQEFLLDFLEFLKIQDMTIKDMDLAIDNYNKWALIYKNRVIIETDANLSNRTSALLDNLLKNAYRSRPHLGFGLKSLVKDALFSIRNK